MTHSEWLSQPRTICGLMSGTSLDGIDAAIVKFATCDDDSHTLELIAHATIDMPRELREVLQAIIRNDRASTADITHAHNILPHLFASTVRSTCDMAEIKVNDLDAIGSHGQTIWHAPQERTTGAYSCGATLQIGSVSALAHLLGVPTVGDFRTADVVLRGQGAPLVPIFDSEFLTGDNEGAIALNIGGIANITLLPPRGSRDNVLAFDTGPGNALIDLATQKYFHKLYDADGSFARAGIVVPALMETLRSEAFITQSPPKSTGRELFNREYLESALEFNFYDWQPTEDALRTITEFTAWSIAENIRRFGNPTAPIIASGGGVRNATLMETLQRELPAATIRSSDAIGIPADAKEAMCFAYLAYRTLGGLVGNIPSVTGATRDAVLGVVARP